MFVKVFHGDRKVHKFRVSIMDQISVLLENLKKEEDKEMQGYFQTRLIYPMGYLRNLSDCLNDTFLD